ncbi:hypothetical protein Jiend_04170 [Micromonospora endophytica]|nr:hypothetical protein Jiend_04170 [Micromonospora endophytica]
MGVEPGVEEIWTLDKVANLLYGKNLSEIELGTWEQRRIVSEVWCHNNPVLCAESDAAGVEAGAELIAQLSGYADARDCATTGSRSACAWTAVALIPAGKVGGILGKELIQWVPSFFRKACSFSSETEVLLADGSTKQIGNIKVGDRVWATNPETGEEGPRFVTHLWVHDDQLVDLRFEKGHLVTTEDHQFWNETDQQWQQSQTWTRGICCGPRLARRSRSRASTGARSPPGDHRRGGQDREPPGVPARRLEATRQDASRLPEIGEQRGSNRVR